MTITTDPKRSKNLFNDDLYKSFIRTLLSANEIYYDSYINNGRIFFFAKKLYDNNLQILSMLDKNQSKIHKQYYEHLEEWIKKFTETSSEKNYNISDNFVFITGKRYNLSFERLFDA